jgi:hypothetical protein
MYEPCVAVLGRRDEPTDAVEEYYRYLADGLKIKGESLELARVKWAEAGWHVALHEFLANYPSKKNRCFFLRYTALAWSRRGIPLQQRRDSPVSVATVFTGQRNDRLVQRLFIDLLDRGITLCPPPLPQQPAGMALAHFVLFARMLHRTTPPLRAQKFPEATSFRICFSRDSSATKRFNFAFSRSSSFIRFA